MLSLNGNSFLFPLPIFVIFFLFFDLLRWPELPVTILNKISKADILAYSHLREKYLVFHTYV